MFWTLWDLYGIWNLLSLGWLLLYAIAFAIALVVFLLWRAVTAPTRFAARAKEERRHIRENAAWRAEMEKRYRTKSCP